VQVLQQHLAWCSKTAVAAHGATISCPLYEVAIGCTGYSSHHTAFDLVYDLMQILSNGFTIGCLTAIALHLILPVSLLVSKYVTGLWSAFPF
jgi:xanthine/uracil permease